MSPQPNCLPRSSEPSGTPKAVKLVDVPLRMALWQRNREGHPVVPGELIGHAEAGSQYTSITFTRHLAEEAIRPSIGSVADAYDNALMECVIGLVKTECIRSTVFHAGPYRTGGDVEYATAGWVDWYNNRRLHSSLEMMTPVKFEQAHYATLNPGPEPAQERQRTWDAPESLPPSSGSSWPSPASSSSPAHREPARSGDHRIGCDMTNAARLRRSARSPQPCCVHQS